MNRLNSLFEDNKKKKETFFYLNGTDLKCLPRQIGELTHLRVLDLSNNQIQSLPKEIGNLSNLEILDLKNNNLESLPIEISLLKKLKSINLSGNNIKELPYEIINLTFLNDIRIDNNPILIPPIEICARGISSIFNYFTSIINSSEKEKIFEAKLLIVGEGNVGKTQLMNSILNNNEITKTTEGIDIQRWLFDKEDINYRVNIWDFGGQEIYHATHQFFLTKRSLYIFVWNARTDDNLLSFDYWLNVIKLIGSEAPVIIVQNKIDERIKNLDEKQIQRSFPNIKCFHNVSALNETNMKELISEIITEISLLDHIGDTLPKVWTEIRLRLESLNSNFISHNDYLAICDEYGLNESQSDYISQYYHDIGVFLHFQSSSILNEKIFLKPEWATNAVYKLIDTKEVISNYGKFHFSDLKVYWTGYTPDNFIYLIELMKKFELCFQFSDTESYIIPELLSAVLPKFDWDDSDNLIMKFGYEFMPKGIITRFIVRNHDLIYENIFSKNGLLIKRNNTFGLIICDDFKRDIDIKIYGYDKSGLLNIIMREMEYIHKTLNYPNTKKYIPCCCNGCLKNNPPHFHNFDTLHKYVEKNIKLILCPKSIEDIEVKTILQGYEKDAPKGSGKGLELVKRLNECKHKSDWSQYEKICTEAFAFLFENDFNSYAISEQSNDYNNIVRRDLLVNNNFKDLSSIWGRMSLQYGSKIILIEFKNYAEKITQIELVTTVRYLNKQIGYFGIIFSRKGLDKNAEIYQMELLNENKLLLSIKDKDLYEMIDSKMKGNDPKDILENLIFTLQKKK